MARARLYRWLALLPALAILVGVPFANRVRPYVLGLPFLMFWILACVLLTSAVMAGIGALDRRPPSEPDPGPAEPARLPRGEAP
ncbi:MAG TPA: DUF3311 domain-containing protein [Candidatus Saccharimonadales bacterium]|nr:DUF3311 domain-containing protein [Candidatus Saccharimonadales bacterium]